jgi:hypothetical protein
VNVTLKTQLAAAATVDPFVQVVPVAEIAKSPALAPLNAKAFTLAKCSEDPPGFVMVIDDALLVLDTTCGLKAIVLAERVTAGGVTPVNVTVCVDPTVPLLSSVNVKIAVRVPTAVGVNVTLQLQTPFAAATVKPLLQGVPAAGATMAKSVALVPAIATVARCNAFVPVFVSVPPIAAPVVPTAWAGKVTVVGASTTTGAVPVPVSATDCVAPATALLSSVKVSEAVRAPTAVGVNFTLQLQFALAATATGVGNPVSQLVPVATREKSDAFVPEMATAVMCSTSVPVLPKVPFCAALEVLTSWLVNVTVVGAGVATGAIPVPESVTGAGFAIPVTTKVMLALRVPAAAGSNVMLRVQMEFGATWPPAVGQVVAGDAKAKSAEFVPVKVMLVTLRGEPPVLLMVAD